MHFRGLIGLVIAAAFAAPVSAQAADAKYPDWKGAWARFVVPGLGGQPSFDQTKPWGLGQQAPLTDEYKKVLEASLADQANGGEGNFFDHAVRCYPGGMPLMMIAFRPLEFVITPHTTYVLIGGAEHFRRIFTDGRDWPKDPEPTYAGYAIGKWLDTDGDGVYDTLEVETRGPFKGPRAYDATGLPLAFDGESIFKERIYRDKAEPRGHARPHHRIRPRPDAAMDRGQAIPPRAEARLGRGLLHREPVDDGDRQGELFPRLRGQADAGPQGPGAARPALFQQADAEVIGARGCRGSEDAIRGHRRACPGDPD